VLGGFCDERRGVWEIADEEREIVQWLDVLRVRRMYVYC